MHSAINLKQLQHNDSQDKIMTQENPLTMQQCSELLQQLSERLETLEKRVASLETPQLMYKPPRSQNYLTLAEALDQLHQKIHIMGKYVN